jgi:hypothetical protein
MFTFWAEARNQISAFTQLVNKPSQNGVDEQPGC